MWSGSKLIEQNRDRGVGNGQGEIIKKGSNFNIFRQIRSLAEQSRNSKNSIYLWLWVLSIWFSSSRVSSLLLSSEALSLTGDTTSSSTLRADASNSSSLFISRSLSSDRFLLLSVNCPSTSTWNKIKISNCFSDGFMNY